MFMDPSAFEVEDIEKELADAGLGPETALGSVEEVDGVSLSSAAGKSNGYNEMLSKAIGKDRESQAPMYGRHSKVAGGSARSKTTLQMAPPSSTPPQGNSPFLRGSTSRGSFSLSDSHCSPGNIDGDSDLGGDREGKFGENASDGFPNGLSSSSTGGANSRARVLAQQREIQRKKRQQALSSGGIRASDAACLSRGLISSEPGFATLTDGGASREGAGGSTGIMGGNGSGDSGNSASRGRFEEGSLFSPSVKQFSAPRQVEGDAYTAFNSSPLMNSERRSSEILTEFDRRRSSRQAGRGLEGEYINKDFEYRFCDGAVGRRREDRKSAVGGSAGVEDQGEMGSPRDEDDAVAAAASGRGGDNGARSSALVDMCSSGGGSGRRAWRSNGRECGSPTTSRSDESRLVERERSAVRRSSYSSPENRSTERSSDSSSDRSSGWSTSCSRSRSPPASRSASFSVPDGHRGGSRRLGVKSPRRHPRGYTGDDRRRSHDPTEDYSGGGRGRGRRRGRRVPKNDSESSRREYHGGDDSDRGDGDEDARYRRGVDLDREMERKERCNHRPGGANSHVKNWGEQGQTPQEGSVERSVDGVERGGCGDMKTDDSDRVEDSEHQHGDRRWDRDNDSDGRSGNPAPLLPHGLVAEKGGGCGGVDASSSGGQELEFNMEAIDLSDMKRFLRSPCPLAAGVVQCYIRRNKTRSNKLFPEYSLFMKEGDRFLMSSKKRPNNATSNYLFSMRAGDLDRNSTNFLGKLRANFVGTEFQVFDDGCNPREQAGTFGLAKTLGGGGGGHVGRPLREELGCVLYASNVLGSRGPRKMQVAIPVVNDDGVVSKWSEIDGGGGVRGAIERIKSHDYDRSLYMVNKPPRWNDQVGAYVLNFYGRVTMASVKNFQLVSTEDFDRIILQFGRVAKDEFTMDFQYPISPFQAFAITLSSFDSKIACD